MADDQWGSRWRKPFRVQFFHVTCLFYSVKGDIRRSDSALKTHMRNGEPLSLAVDGDVLLKIMWNSEGLVKAAGNGPIIFWLTSNQSHATLCSSGPLWWLEVHFTDRVGVSRNGFYERFENEHWAGLFIRIASRFSSEGGGSHVGIQACEKWRLTFNKTQTRRV